MAPDKAPLQEYTIWRATSYNGATREGAGRVGMWNQDEIDAVLQKYEIRGIKRSEERRASRGLEKHVLRTWLSPQITKNKGGSDVVVTSVPLQEKRPSPRGQSQWKVPKDQTENIKCLDQKRNDEGSASLVRSVKARIERSIGFKHFLSWNVTRSTLNCKRSETGCSASTVRFLTLQQLMISKIERS